MPKIWEVMHKLCHKLFQHARSQENGQHRRPAQRQQPDHHVWPSQRGKMTSFRIFICQALGTSNWRSKYISLKGFHSALHLGVQWRHYLIITWLWKTFYIQLQREYGYQIWIESTRSWYGSIWHFPRDISGVITS